MQETICPECGSLNPASEDMCDQCGALLEQPVGVRSEEPAAATCPSCGNHVTPEMRFCTACGMSLSAETAPEPEPEPEPEPAVEPEPPPLPAMAMASAEPVCDEPTPVAVADAAEPAGESRDMAFKLTCVEGFRAGKQYLVYKDDMLLGRLDTENEIFPDIDLEDQDDGYVSRRHARIRCNGDRLLVQDLGGENGTFLDNRPLPPLKEFEVRDKQVIRLGKVSLMLEARPAGEAN